MSVHSWLLLGFVAVSSGFAQAPAVGDGNWPREMNAGNLHLLVYQPQVDTWQGDRIEARSAVTVTLGGGP